MNPLSTALAFAATAGAQSYNGYTIPNYPFGTTFPMLGTQPHDGGTWGGNVYYGTTMKFNDGAYFSYTNSYNVPVYPPPTTPPPTPQYTGPPTYAVPTMPTMPTMPTPAPTITGHGAPCALNKPCAFGFYCKLHTGYNPYQVGDCAKTPSTFPVADGGDTIVGIQLPEGPVFYPGGSCAAPSVCGYQSLNGQCWCDASCQATGDCCDNYDEFCSFVPPPDSGNGNPIYDNSFTQPICPGNCESGQAFYQGSKKCYCDEMCLKWKDCCHDYNEVCNFDSSNGPW